MTETIRLSDAFSPEKIPTDPPISGKATWQEGPARVGDRLAVVVADVPPPPTTYSERISVALSEMREIAEAIAGEHFTGATMRRVASVDEDGEESDVIVLSVRIDGVSSRFRADIAESLLDYLADHHDLIVRRDVTIEVY